MMSYRTVECYEALYVSCNVKTYVMLYKQCTYSYVDIVKGMYVWFVDSVRSDAITET